MNSTLIINTLEKILKYIEPLLPMTSCHMVDFFTDNLYDKYIPPQIRQEISALNSSDVLDVIWNPTPKCNELKKFINRSKENTLPNFPDVCLDINKLEQNLIDSGCQNLSGMHLESFMSFKKSHEVEIMSKIAAAVSEISKTSHIVDIGDGKGYLSSALAMHNNICVLGIDSSVINTAGAAKRVAKINKILGRKENPICNSELYKQTTKFITESTNLTELVKDHFPNYDCDKLGLVGLHTCGDLAPSCLRIFHSNVNIKTICNVGCCYHLLSEKNSAATGFPMSKYLNQRNFKLERNTRMMSAQSLDRMVQNKEKPSDILFYRAVLQVLISKHAPHLIDLQVGRFKKSATFTQYVYKTLLKCNCEKLPTSEEISNLYESYLPKLEQLQVFYLVRAHLAPVVEAVLLLDRLLYLHELGYEKSYLVRLFEPVISPRCYGLIAFK